MLKEHTIKTPKTIFPSSLLSLSSQPLRLDISVGSSSIKYLQVLLNAKRALHMFGLVAMCRVLVFKICIFFVEFAQCWMCWLLLMLLHLLQGNNSEKLNRMDITGVKLTVTFPSSKLHHHVNNNNNAHNHDYRLVFVISHERKIVKTFFFS